MSEMGRPQQKDLYAPRKLMRLIPHIFLFDGWNGVRWSYIPAIGIGYNEGINQAANDFCVGLNHRQFGDGLF